MLKLDLELGMSSSTGLKRYCGARLCRNQILGTGELFFFDYSIFKLFFVLFCLFL